MTGLSSLRHYLPAMCAARGLVELDGDCVRHGVFSVLGVSGSVARCPACRMQEEKAASEAERRAHMLRMSGIPRKYREARFRDLVPVCEEQSEVLAAVKGGLGGWAGASGSRTW